MVFTEWKFILPIKMGGPVLYSSIFAGFINDMLYTSKDLLIQFLLLTCINNRAKLF
jgi:hypothetical protein